MDVAADLPDADAQPWWRKTVVYQIYPRSFFDTNGDGIGDLEGVRRKLDYLAELGVETLWLSPFYASPQADFGYDVSDFRAIAPEMGDLAACDALIREAHLRGLRIVLDMVLNHTSDRHPWFVESRSRRDHPKRDWYVWRDGRRPGGQAPPNRWHSMIGGRGWHYDATTDQWYWAQFLPFQPDLNYRNPEVRAEMLDTVRFWLDRGADGFRLDIINALFEDEDLVDNSWTWRPVPIGDDPSLMFQARDRTLDQPETVEFMRELRAVVDGHGDGDRFLVGEAVAPLEAVRRLCGERADGLHLVFLFRSLRVRLAARPVRALIRAYERLFPEPYLPTWVFSNHDRTRRIHRLGGSVDRAKANVALQLTARGVPFLYYGEEIGMRQASRPIAASTDALVHHLRRFFPDRLLEAFGRWTGEEIDRDGCRTPMQWDDGPNAGFCPESAQPWLPVGPEAELRNVAAQREEPESLLSCYRRFLAARKAHPALTSGDLELVSGLPRDVVGYRRRARAGGRVREAVVYLCLADATRELPAPPDPLVPWVSTVADGPSYDGRTLRLRPWEGVVFACDDADD